LRLTGDDAILDGVLDRRLQFWTFFTVGFACVGLTAALGTMPPPPPMPKPVQTPTPAATDFHKEELRLSLQDCLERAFESNLDLAIQRISPLEARANLLTAKGAYDPVFSLSGGYNEEQTVEDSGPYSYYYGTRNTAASASLNQPLPSGTVIGVTGTTGASENTGSSYDEPWESFSGLTLSQSLLQNFGTDVGEATIRIARRDAAGADAALEYEVDQVITSVANAYYELIYARADYEAGVESLRLAQQLLNDNQERVRIGVMSPLDVSQANSEVAARREDLLTAERTIQDDENAMRLLISKDVAPLLKLRLVPTDLPPDNWTPDPLTPDINTALENRADLRQARDLLVHNQLAEAYRKNQLLPSLGVTGAYGYNGVSNSLPGSATRVLNAENPAWSMGLTLSIPLGDRAEKGQYEAAQYETARQQLILHQLEQNIIIQTDNAGGQAETNRQKIVAARVARQLAEESLGDEEKKLKAGVSTSYTVLQLQRDLHDARIVELRAIADFQESSAQLDQVEGQARAKHNIELRGEATALPTP